MTSSENHTQCSDLITSESDSSLPAQTSFYKTRKTKTTSPAWISCLLRSFFFLKKRPWAPSHLPCLWCPPSSLLSLSGFFFPPLNGYCSGDEHKGKISLHLKFLLLIKRESNRASQKDYSETYAGLRIYLSSYSFSVTLFLTTYDGKKYSLLLFLRVGAHHLFDL